MRHVLRCRLTLLMGMTMSSAIGAQQAAPGRDYLVLVASESVDRVALIRFGAAGATIERERYVGWSTMEVAGPHGVAVAPGTNQYFVTTAHGTPFGRLTKFNTATNAVRLTNGCALKTPSPPETR